MSDTEATPAPQVVQVFFLHIPMPLRTWLKDKGNHIMFSFDRASDADIQKGFSSPTSATGPAPELVEAFKQMTRGAALKFGKKEVAEQIGTDRKLKVRVGKAAALANRKIEWGETDDAYIARVV